MGVRGHPTRVAARVVRTIGWTGLVMTMVFGAVVLGVHMTHPRDEGSYLAYVRAFGDYDGHRVGAHVASGALLAAGERACAWIRQQPPALWRGDQRYRTYWLRARYESQRPRSERGLPRAVVPGAWTYLCPATLELIQPVRLFEDTGD